MSGNVESITERLQARRMLRLERVLRSLLVFFGMDENEMNRGIFREARELLGDTHVPNPDRKWCDCTFGTCQGLDVDRCVFRYVEDCEIDSHKTIEELETANRELLDAINARARGGGKPDEPCVDCGHPAEQHGGLGSVCLVGGCPCVMYRAEDMLPEDLDPKWKTVRDLDREAAILDRKCGICNGRLVLFAAFADTGRPDRVACVNRRTCGAIYRVDYESPNWDLRMIPRKETDES